MRKKIFLCAAMFWVSCSLSAVDIYVNPATGNDSNNGTKAAPLKTIETAVLSKLTDKTQTNIYIADNSVIILTAILNFNTNKNVSLIGKNVTLKAAALAAQTDPSGLPVLGEGNRILRAASGCDLKIKGITFQNGRQIGYILGGAIYFAGNTLEIDSCKFIDNQAGSAGGAVAGRAQSIVIKNSYFEGNNILGGGAHGAAIMQSGPMEGTPGTLSVKNCTFYQNTTQSGGTGSAIDIYDPTDGGMYSNMSQVDVTNCTFLENTSATTNEAVIDVTNSDCSIYLVNNTFYKNSDCALRLLLGQVYLANNVIVGGKNGIMSDTKVADGRPEVIAVNNIIVGTDGGINNSIDDACFTSAASSNSNVVSTTAAYPLSNVALATSLSTDNFVPYLPITSASSTLIDAGIESSLAKFGINYVPTVDIRGLSTNNKKDIGAYEYNGVVNSISSPEYTSENYQIFQSGNTVTVKSVSDKSFSISIVNMTGRVLYSNQVSSSIELSKSTFGQGVFILILNDGNKISSKKILF